MEPRYYLIWRNKFLTTDAESIEDMIAGLEAAVQQLREMEEAGVWLEGGAADDYAYLVTENEDVAEEYGFEEEDEEDEDEEEYEDDEDNYDDEYEEYDEYEYDQNYD